MKCSLELEKFKDLSTTGQDVVTVEKFKDLSTTGQDAYAVLEKSNFSYIYKGAEMGAGTWWQALNSVTYLTENKRWVEKQIREWHLHGLVETKLERLKRSRRQ